MHRALTISMRLLCLALALSFLVFFFNPDLLAFLGPILSVFASKWFVLFLAVEPKLIYLGIATWAFLAHRKAKTRGHRLLLLSIVAVAALVLAAEFIAALQPRFASLIHDPLETTLGYLFAALVLVALLVGARLDARSKRQATAAHGQ
jgi:cation transport ATPase